MTSSSRFELGDIATSFTMTANRRGRAKGPHVAPCIRRKLAQTRGKSGRERAAERAVSSTNEEGSSSQPISRSRGVGRHRPPEILLPITWKGHACCKAARIVLEWRPMRLKVILPALLALAPWGRTRVCVAPESAGRRGARRCVRRRGPRIRRRRTPNAPAPCFDETVVSETPPSAIPPPRAGRGLPLIARGPCPERSRRRRGSISSKLCPEAAAPKRVDGCPARPARRRPTISPPLAAATP